MHNYTLTVGRESDQQFISFPFSFEATAQIPADKLWAGVKEDIENQATAWMWPTQYSQPTVNTGKMHEGCRLTLTYQIPNPNNPGGPKKNATYEFDVREFDDHARHYEYQATPDHPFLRGGGRVAVAMLDDHTSQLRWQGRYQHIAGHQGKEAQGDVFAHFLCSFFISLAQNIKKKVGYNATLGN